MSSSDAMASWYSAFRLFESALDAIDDAVYCLLIISRPLEFTAGGGDGDEEVAVQSEAIDVESLRLQLSMQSPPPLSIIFFFRFVTLVEL